MSAMQEIQAESSTHSKQHEDWIEGKESGAATPAADVPVHITEADNKRILRKIDLVMLSCLTLVYFLQTGDKTIIGLTAVYGLKKDTGLVGNDYSNIGNIGYYAQLGAQPLAALLVVKVNHRILLSVIVCCWACSVLGLAAAHNYTGLMIARFFLGLFEAAALPVISSITIAWWRRAEQPLRTAIWYSTNGMANIICSAIIFGLAKIQNPAIHIYQIVYIFFGLVTFFTGVATFFWLSDSPATARFLSPEDRLKAVERLKANQQGIRSFDFKWSHVIESFTELKFWLFMVMVVCVNAGASVSSVFGPIIIQQLIGFTPDKSVLLNMPFGAFQCIMIFLSCWAATKLKYKGPVLFVFLLPVIAGSAMLYQLPKNKANQGPLLLGYYFLGSVYAGNPLLLSWIAGNVAGQTKKATYYTGFNAANSIGNIIAPYLFQAKYAPLYHTSLQGIFCIFAICAGCAVLQVLNVIRLQKKKERTRVAKGLPAKITDYSMENHYHEAEEDIHGEKGLEDLTDQQNDYYTYLI